MTFECALARGKATPVFRSCNESRTYRRLRRGHYTFEVRAKDALGQLDLTPAEDTFLSRRR